MNTIVKYEYINTIVRTNIMNMIVSTNITNMIVSMNTNMNLCWGEVRFLQIDKLGTSAFLVELCCAEVFTIFDEIVKRSGRQISLPSPRKG